MKVLDFLRSNVLLLATVIAVVMGVTMGMVLRPLALPKDTVVLIGFPGELFMRMLKLLVLPLIVGTIVTGLASLNGRSAGKIGGVTILSYISTTVIAVVIGLALVFSIRPGLVGKAPDNSTSVTDKPHVSGKHVFMDLLRNLFPENIVQAASQRTGTIYTKTIFKVQKANLAEVNSSGSVQIPEVHWSPESVYKPGMNTIGILFYFVVFGVLLGRTGKTGLLMLRFFAVLNDVTFSMVKLVIWYSPLGIMFLVMGKILSIKDLATTAKQLSLFIITNLAALGIHAVIVLPLLYLVITRENPLKVSRGILQAVLTALATDSSGATLPVTIRCCEEVLKINSSIARFVLPIGATINMDGTGIFQVAATVYIAQTNNVMLHFTEVLLISVTATLTSIGTAAVPSGGIVTLIIVLTSVGLPTHDLPLLLAVDWFLGRMRCMVNVSGDCMVAAMLDHLFTRNGWTGKDVIIPEDDRAIKTEEAGIEIV